MATEEKAPISSKTKIIILVIVLLLMAGGAVYYFKQKADKEKSEEKKEEEQPKEPAKTDTKTVAIQQLKADETTTKKQLEVVNNPDKPV